MGTKKLPQTVAKHKQQGEGSPCALIDPETVEPWSARDVGIQL